MLAGAGFAVAGIGGFQFASAGLRSLEAVYEAQNVTMTYDESGNFTDRGSAEEGQHILDLLTKEWKYPLMPGNLDPKDPLVNTPDELMVQYARITYHTLHSTQKVVLNTGVQYDGSWYAAGSYDFPVEGRYWLDFDRMHPIEGKARDLAWTGATHGVLANLAAGTITHNFALFVKAFSLFVMALGAVFVFVGYCLWYAGTKRKPLHPDTAGR